MAGILVDPCAKGVIQSGKASEGCQKTQGRWVLVATILASSMAFIDGTVVNVALPFLQQSLNATVIGVQWVVEAYSLFLSALLLVGGSLGDRYGRRLIFLIGVVVFALASVLCGLATNIDQLIIARAVQGIGGAMLVPGSLAIISNSFAPDQRGKAIGTWSGFSAITTAIGPVLGGWLVQNVSWRAVFFLNLPLALAVVLVSLWQVPESREETQTGSLDWPGATLATIGLAGLVFGLIESARIGFTGPLVIVSLVVGVLALLLFVLQEARSRNPMVPLSLFRSRDFAGANLLTLLLYAALGNTFFFFALNLIQVQGYSATAAGAAILPLIAIMFSLSRWSGGLKDRVGARLPLMTGPTIAAVGFALFALPGVSQNYWTSFFPAVVVLALGMAISVAPLTTTVMSAVQPDQAGVASGINNAVSRAAGLLAIAIFGVVMLHTFSRSLAIRLTEIETTDEVRRSVSEQRVRLAGLELPGNIDEVTRRQLEDSVHGSFVSGFRLIMLTSSALALGGALSAWWLIGRSDRFHPDQDTNETHQQKTQ
ncbi:MAG TPA: MFS transporter [Pyrinomonadaceae bacterium]|nr:MFS transporter [Pyrinomonadaceae bacterium]